MTMERATVRAKFDGRGLVVVDKSANLQEASPDQPLLPYLNNINLSGWKAVHGIFDGWDVILDFELQTTIPYQRSVFMVLMLNQVPSPEGIASTVELQSNLIDELQELRIKEGWEILAGPKHLAKNGLWTIIIWVKNPTGK